MGKDVGTFLEGLLEGEILVRVEPLGRGGVSHEVEKRRFSYVFEVRSQRPHGAEMVSPDEGYG